MSIIINGNFALSSLRKPHVAMSIIGKGHVAVSILGVMPIVKVCTNVPYNRACMDTNAQLSPYSTENWLPNANEIDTKNMKCTCPTQEFYVWNAMQPIFH